MVLLCFVNPHQIIEYVGVENSYLIVFLIAAIGGLSTFTSTTLFTTIATFSAGGAIPWLVGLAAGVGIFISNSVFYLLAALGRKSIPEHWNAKILSTARWMRKMPVWLLFFTIYLYFGFSPLPNDLLIIVLVIARFKYRQVAPILFAGSITVAILTAYLARFGFHFFLQ